MNLHRTRWRCRTQKKETWAGICNELGGTLLGHSVVSGSCAEPWNSHTKLCPGYFELLCSYVKEERLFPLCMYLYFVPDISKFWLPWSKPFCKKRPNIIFFFPTGFYEEIWEHSGLCSTSNELKMLWKTKPFRRKAKMRHQMKICDETHWNQVLCSSHDFSSSFTCTCFSDG